jgi:aldose 1-epimerase
MVEIKSNLLTMEFCPELGGSVSKFSYYTDDQRFALMPSWQPDLTNPESAFNASSYICAPYPNRIKGANFKFDDKIISITDIPIEHALHGYVMTRPWRITATRSNFIKMSFDSNDFSNITYPFPFSCTQSYEVIDRTLQACLTITNSGQTEMPAGLCFHPYFASNISGDCIENPILQFNANGVYPTDNLQVPIPNGPACGLSDEQNFANGREIIAGFDHCFRGWDGKYSIRWPKSRFEVALTAKQKLGHSEISTPLHLVLYSTDEKFAVEPQTMMNDGFNRIYDPDFNDHGVQVLKSGEHLTLNYSLTVRHF